MVYTIADTNTIAQFGEQIALICWIEKKLTMSASALMTPVVTRGQLTEVNSCTNVETPGQVLSEDKSEHDIQSDPDFIPMPIFHATSDSNDSCIQVDKQQRPSDDNVTPCVSCLNSKLRAGTQDLEAHKLSKLKQIASGTKVVEEAKAKAKGKGKAKAPELWEMVKATRCEKDLVRNAMC